MHDTSTRSSPSDRRRLRYGYCTRGLGRYSRMLSAGLQFFCLRPALVAQAMGHFSGQCAPQYTDGITTMTSEACRGTVMMRHDVDITPMHRSTGS